MVSRSPEDWKQSVSQAVGSKVRLRSSHSRLLQQEPRPIIMSPRPRSTKLNAIIVPAARPASFLDDVIELAAAEETLLVVLCSLQAKIDQVAERIARTPGARAAMLEIPRGFAFEQLPARSAARRFREANGHRTSDLSLKRNLGLLFARLNGWHKILFLDDDITIAGTDSIRGLVGQLDDNQIAGMICRKFPDNSVVCHARRLVNLPQDNFVSGSVLGVNCDDLPLPFFPDIYNEDWFFFLKAVARHEIAAAGQASQAEYDPFAHPQRAVTEEFGDFLAEGMYTLIGEVDNPPLSYRELLHWATVGYWKEFKEARLAAMDEILARLDHHKALSGEDHMAPALQSITAARHQLTGIEPALCVDFLEAWQADLADWEALTERTHNIGDTSTALAILGIEQWRLAHFGDADVQNPALLGLPTGLDGRPRALRMGRRRRPITRR
jgi:hypothetical protein